MVLQVKSPSYVRCIKPNSEKKTKLFDRDLVRHQVTYLGLMENLRVRRAGTIPMACYPCLLCSTHHAVCMRKGRLDLIKLSVAVHGGAGFAYRRLYPIFLERYKSLAKATWPNWHGSPKDGVVKIIEALGLDPEDYRLGHTKLFIRQPKTIFKVEGAYKDKMHELASKIAATWKMKVQSRYYKELRQAVTTTAKYARVVLAKRHAEKLKKAYVTMNRVYKAWKMRMEPECDDNRMFVEIVRARYVNCELYIILL